ncbi:putative sulfate exporter family transporter [Dactylosporangium roseum]|uniref:Sulfate exporter family transporter n=1 Tax=Dactylosporangium roseum TaxID=47989 RepID=A0ABY5ZAS0_9ACTN|nr:putative sulfate exporter family transporter [Dactylosporangium roseum]UWZ39173.1 putative sulfate exporter family transporter [Dactylosporangium roseum]
MIQSAPSVRRTGSSSLLPGLVVVVVGVAGAMAINLAFGAVSPLMAALALGAILGNCGISTVTLAPGLAFAARRLLRVGIVLLGVQLAVPDVLKLGLPVLLLVLVTVIVTFFSTQWFGRRLGLSRDRTLLVATGFSICGAAAVAAVDGVTDSDEEDVMTAISLVTLYGCLAMVALPFAQTFLNLPEESVGIWAGASVHEVAQVVATAEVVGSAALATAVVVKLTRVVLLAPLIAGISFWRRRTAQAAGSKKPPLVPLFVGGFLAMMALRSLHLVPDDLLAPLKTAQTVLFTAALFGMGASVRLRALLRTGWSGLAVGLLSTALITLISLAGVLAVNLFN